MDVPASNNPKLGLSSNNTSRRQNTLTHMLILVLLSKPPVNGDTKVRLFTGKVRFAHSPY